MWSYYFNKAIKQYLKIRYRRIENIRSFPGFHQASILNKILHQNKDTLYGKSYSFNKIRNYRDFQSAVPIVEYEDLQLFIERMMSGEPGLLVPGSVWWFAKSSGTTSSKSKYIPVPDIFLRNNLIRSGWDGMSIVYNQVVGSQLFEKKSLVMGGSLNSWPHHPKVTVGDVSAIMILKMPWVGKPFYTPDFEIALMSDWEEKINRMATQVIKEDVVMFGGVPTWNIVLFEKMLALTGKSTIKEIWPNLNMYLHGGVGFEPYRKQFDQYIGTDKIHYFEVYNASEGYFGFQDQLQENGLLLLADNGIFYEFVPTEDWGKPNAKAYKLDQVVPGQNYTMLITGLNGLYRYAPGDTVKFISVKPYKIKITGRTKHFINVFGEEVIVENTDQALSKTCRELNAVVKEYTVGPIYMNKPGQGGHLWLIEFEKAPEDIALFESRLDKQLREVNSDYDAKRFKDLALQPLQIIQVPSGTFLNWLRSKGKAGGQHKVPRLSNTRTYVEEVLEFTR